MLTDTVLVPEVAGDAFQQRLSVCHIVVIREYPLCSDVGKGHHRSPFVNSVFFQGGSQYAVQTDSRYIKRFVRKIVVIFRVMDTLSYIDAHPHRMQDKI